MKSEKKNVVLDTNILISASINNDGLPDQLIRLVFSGNIINYTTPDIIEELKRVFEKIYIKNAVTEKDIEFLIKNFIDSSIIILPKFNEKIIIEDPSDDKFINCALTSKSDIVSGDFHLLNFKNYKGVKIMSAKEFLESLR